MKNFKKAGYLLFLAVIFYGCKKESHQPVTPSKGPDVYLCGTITGPQKQYVAFWKNGVRTIVDSGEYVFARNIAVSDSTIYIIGQKGYIDQQTFLPVSKPICWQYGTAISKSKQPVTSTLGDYDSEVLGIAVSGNHSIIVGSIESYAAYWFDFKPTGFSDDHYAGITAITTSGNDIYVSGSDSLRAGYWKNRKFVILGDKFSLATGIAISGNDVYLSGYLPDQTAGYWKNGVLINLKDNGVGGYYSSGIAVSGSNVYVSGAIRNAQKTWDAVYWKNGTIVQLTHDIINAGAWGIRTYGDDVYVVGGLEYYWKNGNAVQVAGSKNASIQDVFVK